MAAKANRTPTRPPRRAKQPKESRLTAAAVARALGVSDQAVSQWRQAGAPFGPDRRITLSDLRRWELEVQRKKLEEKLAPDSEVEARRRKMAAEAELAELKLARERGQLITIEDAAKAYETRLARLRAVIGAVPSLYAPRVVGLDTMPDAMKVVRTLQAELLEALRP